jgi:hypothetical protein
MKNSIISELTTAIFDAARIGEKFRKATGPSAKTNPVWNPH